MELSLFWLIVPLAAAFGLGWGAARFDRWQIRREPKDAPRAYFEGLNFLLNEQQDKAIDAFIEAVRLDPQTVDLQFALGNLFRRRGEFERSIRVHSSLMARSDLKVNERARAQFELACDYLKAGLLDRAENNYQPLTVNTPYALEAWQALLTIAERSKHWADAVSAAQALELHAGTTAGQGVSYRRWVAQYHCELAELAHSAGNGVGAFAALDAAISANPACVRAHLLRGDWLLLANDGGQPDARAALSAWLQVEKIAPDYINLVAERLARLPEDGGLDPNFDIGLSLSGDPALRASIKAHLQRWFDASPSIDITDSLVRLTPESATRAALLQQFLQRQQSLAAARRVLAAQAAAPAPQVANQVASEVLPAQQAKLATQVEPQAATQAATQAALLKALERGALAGQRYRCASCGFEAKQYFWQCPGCLGWETYPPRRVDDQ